MHRTKIKAAAILTAILLLAAIVAGCGGPSVLPRPSADPNKIVKVGGSCTMTIAGGKATVECKTDAMDGTIFKLSVTTPTGSEVASSMIAKNGDNLKATFDLTGHSETSYYGFATAAPSLYGNQPDAVKAKYGSRFENIDSPAIIWTADSAILIYPSGEIKAQ